MTNGDTLKIGTKVKMVNCVEAKAYSDVVWETRSEPWMCCGTEVVLLKGRAGGFATDCLEVVEEVQEDCQACAIDFDGTDCPFYKVQRPPQSWMYVEGM